MTRVPGADELLFLPLGGSGEIGMNLYLYGHDGRWLMIDLGIGFAGTSLPGVDLLMADPTFISENRGRLAGLLLTHGHEDHIGAVPHIWPELRCPIYATPFTAKLVRDKLEEAGLAEQVEITEIGLSSRLAIGPFDIELIDLTHSIPEPNGVVIRTPAGSVLHTGDWKLDPTPLIGRDYDESALVALGAQGVTAMICDSTNVLEEGEAGSEAEVRERLMELVGTLKERVAVACFASNVARLDSVIKVAQAHGRRVALVGRSMRRIVEAARACGYLADAPPFVAEEDIDYLPRGEVLLLCTGSQGEPRSALSRIADKEHPNVALEPGDAVIFSSKVIPGNESAIFDLQNRLVRLGLELITEDEESIHVSGHPHRDELARMYQWVRPQVAVPVHGEARHLHEHARLARECQVPQQVVAENGAVVRLAPGPAGIVDHVETGRLALEGGRLLDVSSDVFRARRQMSYNGSAVATLLMDQHGMFVGEPLLTVRGILEPESEQVELEATVADLRAALSRLGKAERFDDATVKEAARRAVRRAFNRRFGKRPVTDVHLIRVPI